METEQKCERCVYWDYDAENRHQTVAECCRYPPIVIGDDHGFPLSNRTEWCGEFKHDNNRKPRKAHPGAKED